MKTGCLIYGANGYTGRLIAQRAVDCRLSPILAGRDAHGVRRMAGSLKCAARVFSLSDHATIVRNVRDVRAVLNCAGPFAATAEPMMEACLETGTHYLDITGEIDVIEAAASRGPRADNAGVVLLPAVGFDVVPGDCLAGLLSRKRPAARLLELAIDVRGGVSPGTAATVWTQARHGGRIRRGGRVERVPHAWRMIDVPFPHRRSVALSVPWGDVAAAFHSTGIPNIVVYAAFDPSRSGTRTPDTRPDHLSPRSMVFATMHQWTGRASTSGEPFVHLGTCHRPGRSQRGRHTDTSQRLRADEPDCGRQSRARVARRRRVRVSDASDAPATRIHPELRRCPLRTSEPRRNFVDEARQFS